MLHDGRNGRCLHWLACAAMLLLCAGCGARSEETGGGGMFSFFKDKGAAKGVTTVHADVGAPLVREASLPANIPTTQGARRPRQLALDGVPPRATLVDQAIPGQTTTAFVVERAGQAPLALVNISGTRPRFEVWELSAAQKPEFVRKKTVSLDAAQGSWSGFLLLDAAYLPGNRLLLSVFYYAPHVKDGLFLYDMTNDAYSKVSNVVPYATLDQEKLFEAQIVARDAAHELVLVQYYSNEIRLGPDIYYKTPSHLRLFTPAAPQGFEILQLAPGDGSIEAWAVIDRTLWIQAKDTREKAKPKEFIWSLNLEKVLPR